MRDWLKLLRDTQNRRHGCLLTRLTALLPPLVTFLAMASHSGNSTGWPLARGKDGRRCARVRLGGVAGNSFFSFQICATCSVQPTSALLLSLQISLSTFELIAAAANPEATLDGLRYAGLVVTLLFPHRESVLTVSVAADASWVVCELCVHAASSLSTNFPYASTATSVPACPCRRLRWTTCWPPPVRTTRRLRR